MTSSHRRKSLTWLEIDLLRSRTRVRCALNPEIAFYTRLTRKKTPHYFSDLVFFVMAASDFYETLNRLGLSQYHDSLVQEAFDSWDVLADITEEDL
jgi:hypothetical protein